MPYHSNRDAYRRAFAGEMVKRVKAASIYLSSQVKSEISQPGTLRYHPLSKKTGLALKSQKTIYNFTHSRPGNPPYKQTGALRASIAWEVDPGRIVGRVGSGIKRPAYPLYLELGTRRMKARPYLRPALAVNRTTLLQILTRRIPAGGLTPISSYQIRPGHFGAGARKAGFT